jgi:hypothetical protein
MISTTKLFRPAVAALAAASLVSFSSCTPYQGQGAGVGALAGGTIGALAGDDGGDILKGAALGAAAGAGAAALKEQHDKKKESQNPSRPKTSGHHPTGYKTQDPFQIISPFKPNNLIDISKNPKTGQPFVSGDYAKDPSNGQIFRIP